MRPMPRQSAAPDSRPRGRVQVRRVRQQGASREATSMPAPAPWQAACNVPVQEGKGLQCTKCKNLFCGKHRHGADRDTWQCQSCRTVPKLTVACVFPNCHVQDGQVQVQHAARCTQCRGYLHKAHFPSNKPPADLVCRACRASDPADVQARDFGLSQQAKAKPAQLPATASSTSTPKQAQPPAATSSTSTPPLQPPHTKSTPAPPKAPKQPVPIKKPPQKAQPVASSSSTASASPAGPTAPPPQPPPGQQQQQQPSTDFPAGQASPNLASAPAGNTIR
eukprot:PhM_4_TR1282/c3_g2_i2/m.7370